MEIFPASTWPIWGAPARKMGLWGARGAPNEMLLAFSTINTKKTTKNLTSEI